MYKIFIKDHTNKQGEIKSILVTGETKPLAPDLLNLRGKWNRYLNGWVFSKKREAEIKEALKEYI